MYPKGKTGTRARNPYALNVLGRAGAVISAYDVAPACLQAGVELLQGKFAASGQLPVHLDLEMI